MSDDIRDWVIVLTVASTAGTLVGAALAVLLLP
jgi:hypothetical protein